MKKVTFIFLFIFLTSKSNGDEFYWGAGTGYFDVDYEDSYLPHFGSQTFNIMAGYKLNDYFAAELQFENIAFGSETDAYGFESSFEARALSPSILVKLPLTSEGSFEIFGRLGGSFMDYKISTPSLAGHVDGLKLQPVLGAGIRTKHIFVEYVNYGVRDDLYLEQVRVGFQVKF